MEPADEPKRVMTRSVALSVGFVAVIQLVALYFTHVNAPVTQESGYSYAPAGTSSAGSAWNAIILVLIVFATTMAALWLIRHRKVRVFTSVVFLGTALALFLLTLLTAIDATAAYMDPYTSLYLSLALAASVVAVLAATALRPRLAVVAPLLTGLLSAEVGSYFASTIPLLTALLLPIAFSLYDVYAVFRGPLKQLVTSAPVEVLTTMSSRLGDLTVGMGDTIFYSMLPALAFYQFSLLSAIYTMVAIDVGVAITLLLLARAKMLPGLPIPMALGLATLLLSALVRT